MILEESRVTYEFLSTGSHAYIPFGTLNVESKRHVLGISALL